MHSSYIRAADARRDRLARRRPPPCASLRVQGRLPRHTRPLPKLSPLFPRHTRLLPRHSRPLPRHTRSLLRHTHPLPGRTPRKCGPRARVGTGWLAAARLRVPLIVSKVCFLDTLLYFLDTRLCFLDTLFCLIDTLFCFLDTLFYFLDTLVLLLDTLLVYLGRGRASGQAGSPLPAFLCLSLFFQGPLPGHAPLLPRHALLFHRHTRLRPRHSRPLPRHTRSLPRHTHPLRRNTHRIFGPRTRVRTGWLAAARLLVPLFVSKVRVSD